MTSPTWPPSSYMVKTSNILFSSIIILIAVELDMKYLVLEYLQVDSNTDLRLTLSTLTTRLNLLPVLYM